MKRTSSTIIELEGMDRFFNPANNNAPQSHEAAMTAHFAEAERIRQENETSIDFRIASLDVSHRRGSHEAVDQWLKIQAAVSRLDKARQEVGGAVNYHDVEGPDGHTLGREPSSLQLHPEPA